MADDMNKIAEEWSSTIDWLCGVKHDQSLRRVIEKAFVEGYERGKDYATHVDGLTVSDDAGVISNLCYRLARHVRNTDETPPARWAVQGVALLDELRSLDIAKYFNEVCSLSRPQPAPSTDDNPEPTAETRGDEGFEAWWNSKAVLGTTRHHVINDRDVALTIWNAARAELLAKVAGVRAELEAEKKRFCDSSDIVWALNRSVRTLDLVSPSDPGAGRAD